MPENLKLCGLSCATGSGPVGKARRAFEQVSKLPRNQQKHIIRVVEDLLVAQRNGA